MIMTRLILTAVGGDPAETIRLDYSPDSSRTEPEPALGPQELLVAMEAAPINPADLLLAAGWFAVQPEVPGWPMGAEGVGRVLRAGSTADQALVGRRVIILPTFEQGTWAERVVVAARNVVVVGEGGDVQQLAMLGVNPATAYALLHDYVALKPGDWVGQNLGNSAVGQYVTALARQAGVRTLSVVRRADGADRLRALGADVVLTDGPNLPERIAEALGGSTLKLVLDGVGGAKTGDLTGALEAEGTVVSYSSQTGESPILPLPDLIYRGIKLRSYFVVRWVKDTPRETLETVYAGLATLIEKGVIHSPVEATYPLSAHAEAFARVLRAERSGKILFTPGA
jgi:NADPH:quinone reductase-like Zn-dependent oxidoreductase